MHIGIKNYFQNKLIFTFDILIEHFNIEFLKIVTIESFIIFYYNKLTEFSSLSSVIIEHKIPTIARNNDDT